MPGQPAQSGASASPTETPQLSDMAADPHRNPTDETAHSGTLGSGTDDTSLRGTHRMSSPASTIGQATLEDQCW